MSAVVGVYHPDGRPVERTDLERMVEALAHRGPDGAGMWNKGPIGLGHRMHWTTPESLQERLPMMSQAGNLVLTRGFFSSLLVAGNRTRDPGS